MRAPPPPAREEPPAADETVADSSAEADAAYIAGQSPSPEGSRPVTPPPMSPIAEEPAEAPIPTATPATDALAAESISLAVWALDASKAVEKPDEIPAPQPHQRVWRPVFRTVVFVSAFAAAFFAIAPLPAVVAPIACLAGLEVCGVCGPTCDAVCTH